MKFTTMWVLTSGRVSVCCVLLKFILCGLLAFNYNSFDTLQPRKTSTPLKTLNFKISFIVPRTLLNTLCFTRQTVSLLFIKLQSNLDYPQTEFTLSTKQVLTQIQSGDEHQSKRR